MQELQQKSVGINKWLSSESIGSFFVDEISYVKARAPLIHDKDISSTKKPPILSEDRNLLTPTDFAEIPTPLANSLPKIRADPF